MKTLGMKVKQPASSMSGEWAEVVAWACRWRAEHGVGFPASKQHCGLCDDVGTEQGGCTAWLQRAGGDFGGKNANVGFVCFGWALDGVGDVCGLGWREPVDGQVVIADSVNGCGWWLVRCLVKGAQPGA